MILNKRIKRELKNNIFRYGALFFMLVLGMSMVIGTSAATDSVINTIKECNKKNNIENGEFSVFVPLSGKDKEYLKRKGVQIEENFYMDFDLDNSSTLRVFKNRKGINLVQLNEGKLAVKDNEIVLEKHYAKNHNYSVNDIIRIADKKYIVTGIGTVPDYNLVMANPSDISSNIQKFSISFVSEKAYNTLKSSGRFKSSEEYCYSYILKGEMTDKELKDYLVNMDFDKEKITNIYMKQVIEKIENNKKKLIKSTEEIRDGSKNIADKSTKLKDGANKLEGGAIKLRDGLENLSDGAGTLSGAMGELRSGIDNIKSGTASLKRGSESLEEGLNKLTANNKALINGAEVVFNSMLVQASLDLSNITGKNISLNKNNYEQILNNLMSSSNDERLQRIILNIKKQLMSYKEFYDGLKNYLNGVDASYKGAVNLAQGAAKIDNGSQKLQEGASKVYNAGIKLKNGSEKLEKGSKDLKSGISKASKGASEFNKGNKELYKGTEKFKEGITKFANDNMNYKYENLTSFLVNKDNPRINGAEDDTKINKVVSMFSGIIFIILVAYMISVFITHNIEKESAVIGTLYSMGYLKKELLIHFLILPVVIVSLGGIIGTIIGFSLIPYMAKDSALYFSFPDVKKYYSLYLIGYGIIVPTLIAIIVNIVVINKKLSKEPLKLLRKEKKQNKISNINLGNMGFINRYRIRQQLREIRGNIILVAGLFLSILLMIFAFTIYGSITNLVDNTSKDVKFNYMYLLKYPPEENPDKSEACYTKSLNIYYDLLGADLEVAALGIDSNNPYYNFKVKCNKDEIYISDSVSKKFGYKKGDKITLNDNLEDKNYTFTVADIVKYSHGLYVFMDIDNMREVFGKQNNYYNTLLSDKKINIDSGRVLSVTTHKEIVDGVSLFLDNMFGMIVSLLIVSILVFMLVMYLLLKMMIDKGTFSISLIKVFGFNDKEINKLYPGSSLYTVLIAVIISIPMGKLIMNNIYPSMVANVATAMPAYIYPMNYVIIIAIIFVSYFIVNLFLKKHLKKVSLVEILKDRE
ncbi:FtsX-like permease family protein [Clostridium sporogenes]|uniref:ABC transporter permease n=1 Tax=Clostridium sporogenes TaxID=1509 RepID=UPI0013D5B510|nr:FtsX-like permease family protein [Clostridium sporogenes]NFL78838.1 FtsX-like permease family protein [Clostridium sporogenes]